MKLNGWQRLWIVISILYLVPVAGLMFLLWPTGATTGHRDEFIERMPPELRANVDGAYDSEWKWEELWKARVGKARVGTTPELQKWKARVGTTPEPKKTTKGKNATPLPPGFTLLSPGVSFPNGGVLDIRAPREGDTERVAAAYWAVVEAEARAEQWKMVWQLMLVWIIPCLALYMLGWVTAWVRRGFKSGGSGGAR